MPKSSKIAKKTLLKRCGQNICFKNEMSSICNGFNLPKSIPDRKFLPAFFKTSILRKSAPLSSENLFFEVRSLQKAIQNRCQNAFEKNVATKWLKTRFGNRVGLHLTRIWSPKRTFCRNSSKLVLRRHATCQEIVASQRDLELRDCLPGLSKD